jgi:mannosyltransferase
MIIVFETYHIDHKPFYGGVINFYLKLMQHLDSLNIKFYIITYDNSKLRFYKKFKNAIIIKEKPKLLELLHRVDLSKFKKNDLIIFMSTYYRLPRYNIKNLYHINVIHDFIHYKNRFKNLKSFLFFYFLQKKSIIKSDVNVSVSKTTKQNLIEVFGKKYLKTYIIYMGCDFDLIKKIKKKKYFLYIGHRSKYKKFDFAIKLLNEHKDFNLICTGGDNNKKTFFNKIPLNLHSRIIFYPYVNEDRLTNLYANAFCLLYLSESEGFGIPIIEGLRCYCPVVYNYNNAAAREIIKKNGYYFKYNQFSNLNNLIKKMKNQKLDIVKLDRAQKYSKKFCWKLTFNKYMNLIYKISSFNKHC